jgi:hypothetical protein
MFTEPNAEIDLAVIEQKFGVRRLEHLRPIPESGLLSWSAQTGRLIRKRYGTGQTWMKLC